MHISQASQSAELQVASIAQDPSPVSTKCTPLQQSHMSRAVRTWVTAFSTDPIQRYARYIPGYRDTCFRKTLQKLGMFISITRWIHVSTGLTINDGAAFIIYTHAKTSGKVHRSPMRRFISFVGQSIQSTLVYLFAMPEQRKRRDEVYLKFEKVTKDAFGDKLDDMLYLDALVTEPASQGKGYGGFLVDSVTAVADEQSRSIWLISSNVANTRFYESHGFETVGEILVGDDNPAWHEAPVLVRAMMRHPKVPECSSEENPGV